MKIELYDSDVYDSIEDARKDGAINLFDTKGGFIEGVKAACVVLGKDVNTIKFKVNDAAQLRKGGVDE